MTLCIFLCSNEIKARKHCRLLSSRKCSNVFETSADIFGNVRKSSESCRKSLKSPGRSRKFWSRQGENLTHLNHAGIYHTGQLLVSARKPIRSVNVNIA